MNTIGVFFTGLIALAVALLVSFGCMAIYEDLPYIARVIVLVCGVVYALCLGSLGK